MVVPNVTRNLTNITTPAKVNAAAMAAASWEGRWSVTFIGDHWQLVFIMFIELLIVAGLYVYHLLWTRAQKKQAKESSVMRLCEAYSLELLRRYLPTAKVEKYRFRGMRQKPAIATISFENVGLELPNGERILEGVTGEFRAGRMCAIMGPSGAGKTSFINVLCGKAGYGKPTGSIRFNGQEGRFKEYRSVMGFVPQEDIVHEGLTVGEQIRFSADLRNPRGTPAAKRRLISEDVLNVMQIDHIQNSIVGTLESRGISGGQRKRVSIGLELAADPTVLFLDEPTSGLDATSSLAIVHSLKRMAQLGMTSVMVVHQPRYSLFSLFDDVLLLGRGGRTVYLGPALGARPYFERLGFQMPEAENPADWFMDLIAGEVPNHKIVHFSPDMLFELWEENRHTVEAGMRHRAQASIDQDDWETMMDKLDEEWPRISYASAPSSLDPAREGVLREKELLRLMDPENEGENDPDVKQAVHELFGRIAGPNALVATRREVLEFLAGLQGVVAADRIIKKPVVMARKGSGFSSSSRSSRSPQSSVSEDAGGLPASAISPRIKAAWGRNSRQPSIIPEEDSGVLQLESRSDRAQEGPPALPKLVRQEVLHGAPPPPEDAKVMSHSGHSGELGPPADGASVSEPEPDLAPESVGGVPSEGEANAVLEERAGRSRGSRSGRQKVRSEAGAHYKEITITLDVTEGGALGAVLSRQDDGTLFVEAIIEGLVKQWNNGHPGERIRKGDRFVDVNGASGTTEALLEELDKPQLLKIRVRRDRRRRDKYRVSRSTLQGPGTDVGGGWDLAESLDGDRQSMCSEQALTSVVVDEVPGERDNGDLAQCEVTSQRSQDSIEQEGPPTLFGRIAAPFRPRFSPRFLPHVFDRGSPKVVVTSAPDVGGGEGGGIASTTCESAPHQGTTEGLVRVGLFRHSAPEDGASAGGLTPGRSSAASSSAASPHGPGRVLSPKVPEGLNGGDVPLPSPVREHRRSRRSRLRPGDEDREERRRRRHQRSQDSSPAPSSDKTDRSPMAAIAAQVLLQDAPVMLPPEAVGATPRLTEEALAALSPRTRAVWSKKLEDCAAPPNGGDSQPRTLLQHRTVRVDPVASTDDETASSEMTGRSGSETTDLRRQMPPAPPLPHVKSMASVGVLARLARSSQPPGFLIQLMLLFHRSSIQWWRGNRQRGIFVLVLMGSSSVLAVMDTWIQKEGEWQVQPYLNLHTALALLTSVFCLGVFANDRPVFWRERESGLSVAAFYASKVLVNGFDLILQCYILAAVYYVIRQPFVDFGSFFQPFLLVSFAASGVGYVISTLFPPRHGPFVAAIVIFVWCGLLGHPLTVKTMSDGGGFLEAVLDSLSITRWSVAFFFVTYMDNTPHADLASASSSEKQSALAYINSTYRQTLKSRSVMGIRTEVAFLLGMGLVWHMIGYLILRHFSRNTRAASCRERVKRAVALGQRLRETELWSKLNLPRIRLVIERD